MGDSVPRPTEAKNFFRAPLAQQVGCSSLFTVGVAYTALLSNTFASIQHQKGDRALMRPVQVDGRVHSSFHIAFCNVDICTSSSTSSHAVGAAHIQTRHRKTSSTRFAHPHVPSRCIGVVCVW